MIAALKLIAAAYFAAVVLATTLLVLLVSLCGPALDRAQAWYERRYRTPTRRHHD